MFRPGGPRNRTSGAVDAGFQTESSFAVHLNGFLKYLRPISCTRAQLFCMFYNFKRTNTLTWVIDLPSTSEGDINNDVNVAVCNMLNTQAADDNDKCHFRDLHWCFESRRDANRRIKEMRHSCFYLAPGFLKLDVPLKHVSLMAFPAPAMHSAT